VKGSTARLGQKEVILHWKKVEGTLKSKQNLKQQSWTLKVDRKTENHPKYKLMATRDEMGQGQTSHNSCDGMGTE